MCNAGKFHAGIPTANPLALKQFGLFLYARSLPWRICWAVDLDGHSWAPTNLLQSSAVNHQAFTLPGDWYTKYLCRQGKEMPGGANVDAPPLFLDRHTEERQNNSRSVLEESLSLKKLKKLRQLSMYSNFVWQQLPNCSYDRGCTTG